MAHVVFAIQRAFGRGVGQGFVFGRVMMRMVSASMMPSEIGTSMLTCRARSARSRARRASTSPAAFELFLKRFPDGTYADFARHRLEELNKQAQSAQPTAQSVTEEQKKFLGQVLTYYKELAGEKSDDTPNVVSTWHP